MEKLALENKPKLIIGGGSAYSREWDYKRMREIADKVGALLMIDMAVVSSCWARTSRILGVTRLRRVR